MSWDHWSKDTKPLEISVFKAFLLCARNIDVGSIRKIIGVGIGML